MSTSSSLTSQGRQNTNFFNSANPPYSKIEEIRMNLRHPQSIKKLSSAHRYETFQNNPTLSPKIQSYVSDENPDTNDKSPSISHLNHTSTKTNDLNRTWFEYNDNNNNNNIDEVEPYNIMKELITYYDLLDLDRQKSIEESRRLKSINNELSSMLENSNAREEQNHVELNKQRKHFTHWQTHFSKLKDEAHETISTLLNQRKKLLDKLNIASSELKRLNLENDTLSSSLKKLEHDFQIYQKYYELYQTIEQEKRTRETEHEALLLKNSKLMNERNAIESDRNRLQSIVDEMEAEKNNKDNSIPLMLNKSNNFNALMPQLAEHSPFEQISQSETYDMISQFENSNLEQKHHHFVDLLDQLRNFAAMGEKYWEYTQFLMSELDNRGIQPSTISTNAWNLDQT